MLITDSIHCVWEANIQLEFPSAVVQWEVSKNNRCDPFPELSMIFFQEIQQVKSSVKLLKLIDWLCVKSKLMHWAIRLQTAEHDWLSVILKLRPSDNSVDLFGYLKQIMRCMCADARVALNMEKPLGSIIWSGFLFQSLSQGRRSFRSKWKSWSKLGR